MSAASAHTAGILLLTLVAVAYGGAFVLRVTRGSVPATDFQHRSFRAGHAHAGVFVILGVLCQLLVDRAVLGPGAEVLARQGVPLAAILVPAAFFLSAAGRGRERPSRWILLLWPGVLCLTAGLVSLGVGLLRA
ncbi:hypothetical protein CLV92_101262 [Kineococcus xinjiangensis]|uniref:Uncharacterized protein n=1 Tax=Kineococcus xinjiangensis TaxID=512762 RepID=A0A2S6IWB2_9ACTN|nr:hypothetical protein [Kineococcus xinjiangensis]PPK98566.1 hypothetical protein CLV92_101262 [Kineococcus xinjiangensis]